MKMKRFIAMVLSIAVMIIGLGTTAYAVELESAYQITDDYVVIDSIYYEIVNNNIQYNGETYEIKDYTLISYDESGEMTIIVLPVEQNRITDPTEIALLNARLVDCTNLDRAVPSNPENLPYSADVPEGQWYTETPAVNLIDGQFYYKTKLTLSNFPFFADKRFSVGFMYCDNLGNWYTHSFHHDYDFGTNSTIKYANLSIARYGMFNLACLYGNPTTSYRYTISLSNL